jgi:hypothetical protein
MRDFLRDFFALGRPASVLAISSRGCLDSGTRIAWSSRGYHGRESAEAMLRGRFDFIGKDALPIQEWSGRPPARAAPWSIAKNAHVLREDQPGRRTTCCLGPLALWKFVREELSCRLFSCSAEPLTRPARLDMRGQASAAPGGRRA